MMEGEGGGGGGEFRYMSDWEVRMKPSFRLQD